MRTSGPNPPPPGDAPRAPDPSSGEAVLLVDDDAAFREVYSELLRAEGYSVVEAGAQEEAFNRLRKSAARLVVLDLMLPPSHRPEDGAALSRRMLAERPSSKIIVVSGASDTPLALRVVEDGAYDFLAKPVDPDVLLAVLKRAAARLALEDR
ncbi:MAG TPA: response regulator, partial [Polyangiaceae bacterium]|nr:response regulator [Polyangiaceae bacterium]